MPRSLAVAHHDPQRDYQIGVQQTVRAGPGSRAERIELPAVLSATAARGIAERALIMTEAARTRRVVSAGIDRIGLPPGAAVRIDGEAGVWRACSVAVEGMATRIELVPVSVAPIVGTAPSGRVSGAPDRAIGSTLLMAFEYPALSDVATTAPQLSVLATGVEPGWRGAALLYSLDDGESWIAAGATAAPATLGVVEGVLGDGPATLVDRSNVLNVTLARDDMVLGDADNAGLAQGRNLALVGAELIQFGSAMPLGAGRWRLSELRRGVRGTDWASAAHRAGEAFALIESDAVVTIAVPLGTIGHRVRLLATGIGDVSGPAATDVDTTGASVVPPAPVHLMAGETANGGWRIAWTRRSRAGWAWVDGIDAPLAEEQERYAVDLIEPGGAVSSYATLAPVLNLAVAPPAGTRAAVRQLGTYGASRATTMTIGGA